MEILTPKLQLNLFGYEKLFNSFTTLLKKNKLPNVMLFSGPKGLGKSTFAYHFINFLLSHGDEDKYLVDNFKINSNNSSFKLIQQNVHPNFFLIENNLTDGNIKVEQVRNLIKFLNKSTYTKNLKIVLIDNVEYLNLNASNALLKSLEEPSMNTYFFIIHNDASRITDTIKSRSTQFKFHFSLLEKKNIFKKIAENYQLNFNEDYLGNFFYFETPGNLLRYLLFLEDTNFNLSQDSLSCILFLIEKYKNKKDPELLNLITMLIENFYNELSLKFSNNINIYFVNKNKISYLINDMKKFSLDKKNLLTSISGILKNEA